MRPKKVILLVDGNDAANSERKLSLETRGHYTVLTALDSDGAIAEIERAAYPDILAGPDHIDLVIVTERGVGYRVAVPVEVVY